ncbi:hypothetical protein C1Y40_04933 [Mycobacterium talmoniae]|uniref:Uncharacterized protein n=1 Tax=Mycobacterium talmoniae TaxID=1858794 RepID=A0A2S8BE09_9MYCO|nr:hypothetical protein C1Y40_04933 [Mycobacterium talmoniae]
MPRRRAAASVSIAPTPASTAAPTHSHGPQVASGRSRPGRNPAGGVTVTGTVTAVGTWTWWSSSSWANAGSLSIGARSTTQRSCPAGAAAPMNIQSCAIRLACANCGPNAGPAV